jgi:serine O-acetyltransferase
VLGAGSVLTKNPGPFEIWAGNPARKIGQRKEMTREAIEAVMQGPRFRLPEDTGTTS